MFRIPELVQKKYEATQRDGLKALMDKLAENVLIAQALTARTKTIASANKPGVQPQRTSASPDWLGEVVPNYRKRLVLSSIGVSEFDGSNPSGAWC